MLGPPGPHRWEGIEIAWVGPRCRWESSSNHPVSQFNAWVPEFLLVLRALGDLPQPGSPGFGASTIESSSRTWPRASADCSREANRIPGDPSDRPRHKSYKSGGRGPRFSRLERG